MLTRKNKMMIGIYRRAANLDEAEYRQLLKTHSGCVSSTESGFTQTAFDRVMAALERQLFLRVDHKAVQNPIGLSEHIRRRDYWQRRLASTQAGLCNTRQQYLIRESWGILAGSKGYSNPNSPDAIAYLSGIVRKATGLDQVGHDALTSAQAAAVIDAIKDRLNHLEPEEKDNNNSFTCEQSLISLN